MNATTEMIPALVFRVQEKFEQLYGAGDTLTVRSPGRVNLIGEHTDYNNGFVLPAAIDKAIYMVVRPRQDQRLRLYSYDLGQSFETVLGQLILSGLHWPDFVLGVVQQIKEMGHPVRGFDLVFGGDIPLGAGMSSSAALECATAFALNEVFSLGLDKLTMVKLSQRAENVFVGLQCGIMDMFASMYGRKDHVIRLDCRSLAYSYFPFKTDGIRIVLLDTHVKHSLASSEYNTRRQQCEAGVEMVRRHHPGVKSLRDVDADMLSAFVKPVDELIFRRCSYVVEENARLLAATEDLERGDISAFGRRLYGSHEGLSTKYEVSCPELDFLVAQVRDREAVIGARMMGGGFGGCTINLVREDAVQELITWLTPVYRQAMGKELTAYMTQIENGTSVL